MARKKISISTDAFTKETDRFKKREITAAAAAAALKISRRTFFRRVKEQETA